MFCKSENGIINYHLLLKEPDQNKMEKLKSFDEIVFSGRIIDVTPGFGSFWATIENDTKRFESLYLRISEVVF